MIHVHNGDALAQLRQLPADLAHCIVTSPPYWGLRDYGIAGQLGQEPTPEEYVVRLVSILREARRVLRQDGTLWLNLGDCYAREGGAAGAGKLSKVGMTRGNLQSRCLRPPDGLKHKDLVGIPWRVALALQADGWYLRSDIIWAKPNPLPESVQDRPTKAHEYVFLLSKSERYYFDGDALREPAHSERPAGNGFAGRQGGSARVGKLQGGEGTSQPWSDVGGSRNIRSVWHLPTQPSNAAHFAVMAPEIARRCVVAGSPRGGGVILDCFAGSGTTAIVADLLGREGHAIEINPAYIAAMSGRAEEIRRWWARREGLNLPKPAAPEQQTLWR